MTSKLMQKKSGVKGQVVCGMVNVLSTQLLYMRGNAVHGGWEEFLKSDRDKIRGSRVVFLNALVKDIQLRFGQGEWVDENVPEWVERSSCSCERLFSFVGSSDHGQTTKRMSDALLVRCNGQPVERWCPKFVFDALRGREFRPNKRKQTNEPEGIDLEDGMLSGFLGFKDLVVDVPDENINIDDEIRNLWAVPKRPSPSETIEDTYGLDDVGSDDDMPIAVTSSDPTANNNLIVPIPPSDIAPSVVVFQYPVDQGHILVCI